MWVFVTVHGLPLGVASGGCFHCGVCVFAAAPLVEEHRDPGIWPVVVAHGPSGSRAFDRTGILIARQIFEPLGHQGALLYSIWKLAQGRTPLVIQW